MSFSNHLYLLLCVYNLVIEVVLIAYIADDISTRCVVSALTSEHSWSCGAVTMFGRRILEPPCAASAMSLDTTPRNPTPPETI